MYPDYVKQIKFVSWHSPIGPTVGATVRERASWLAVNFSAGDIPNGCTVIVNDDNILELKAQVPRQLCNEESAAAAYHFMQQEQTAIVTGALAFNPVTNQPYTPNDRVEAYKNVSILTAREETELTTLIDEQNFHMENFEEKVFRLRLIEDVVKDPSVIMMDKRGNNNEGWVLRITIPLVPDQVYVPQAQPRAPAMLR